MATYYVNINNAYETEGDGSEGDPFNWTQFMSEFLGGTQHEFFVVGTRTTTASVTINSGNSLTEVKAWDISDPWRIITTNQVSVFGSGGFLSDGIVSTTDLMRRPPD